MMNHQKHVTRAVGRWPKHLFIILAATAAVLLSSTSAQGVATQQSGRHEVHHRARVTLTRLGHPDWKPVDFNLFTAPIGTNASGYAEFSATQQTVLPPPHYKPYPGLGIGPGTPEAPPYDRDVSEGVEHGGYREKRVFLPSDFSNGSGIYFAYMVVPRHGSHQIGSSPDFARGPIIPNSLFPIQVTGATYRNGSVYDANLANFTVPALNDPSVMPPFHVDGHSHFPIFTADNADFGPTGTPLPGTYSYRLTMKDRLGNGWMISVAFKIEPPG